MENQHRKIVGYRELSQEDIDLMNRIKAAGRELLALQAEVVERIARDKHVCRVIKTEGIRTVDPTQQEEHEADVDFVLSDVAEPGRWAAIAKTDIQTGVMALVRAVAQPTDS